MFPLGSITRRKMTWLIAIALVCGAGLAAVMFLRVKVPTPPEIEFAAKLEPIVVLDITTARNAVLNDTRSATAWGEYGEVLRAYTFDEQANVCFRVASSLATDDGRWPYLLADNLNKSDPTAAIEWFALAAKRTVPENVRDSVKLRYVETLLALDRAQDARAELGENPKSDRAKIALAKAAIALGDKTLAAVILSDMSNHPTASRQVLLLQAEIYRDTRPSFAADAAKRAIKAPDMPWPDPLVDGISRRDHSRSGLLDQAAELLGNGKLKDAEKILRPLAVSTSPDAKPYVGLAEAYMALGDFPAAVRELENGLKIEPKSVLVNFQRGKLHFALAEELIQRNQPNEAKVECQKAIERLDVALAANPDFGKALLIKGTALAEFLDKPAEGIAILRRFVVLRPEVSEGHYLLGRSLAKQSQLTEAASCFRTAASLAATGDNRARQALQNLEQNK